MFAALVLTYALLRTIDPVRGVIGYVEHGVLVVGTHLGNATGRLLTSEDSLTAQLAVCEDRLRSAAVDVAVCAEDARNAHERAALMGYVEESGTTAIAARITLRALPEVATVAIDKGADDGVAAGDAVVVDGGHLYGVVHRVDAGSAVVRLAHSKASRIPSAILGTARTIGLVAGQEGTLLNMAYIPEDTDIAVGSVVVTSGLDSRLPPNLVLGVVTSVLHEDAAPFLEALIEPLYDAREWANVLVLSVNDPSL